jgi:hypothetical protein
MFHGNLLDHIAHPCDRHPNQYIRPICWYPWLGDLQIVLRVCIFRIFSLTTLLREFSSRFKVRGYPIIPERETKPRKEEL